MQVLVLLPFRSSALKFVDRLLNMVPALQKVCMNVWCVKEVYEMHLRDVLN